MPSGRDRAPAQVRPTSRSRSPQPRLRAHEEANRPDEGGHRVADVSLAFRALAPEAIVDAGTDPDEATEVGTLDEERNQQIRGVDRERRKEPGLAQERAAERRH